MKKVLIFLGISGLLLTNASCNSSQNLPRTVTLKVEYPNGDNFGKMVIRPLSKLKTQTHTVYNCSIDLISYTGDSSVALIDGKSPDAIRIYDRDGLKLGTLFFDSSYQKEGVYTYTSGVYADCFKSPYKAVFHVTGL